MMQRRGRERLILIVTVAAVLATTTVTYSVMSRDEGSATPAGSTHLGVAPPPPKPTALHTTAVPTLDDEAEPTAVSPLDAGDVVEASFVAEECATRAASHIFDLDKPRAADEATFCHVPKSQGGVLAEPRVTVPVISEPPRSESWDRYSNDTRMDAAKELATTARVLYDIFKLYDDDEASPATMPVYGTMCVGKDCRFIPAMFANLRIGIGHIIVVVNTNQRRWVTFFRTLQRLFPGRFTMFYRPHKLSCAESWNVIARMGFSIRPMVEQVFIANADWHPIATPGIDNNMARFAEWSRTSLHLVVNRYFLFSSFSFTKRGYLELGYFDEVIYPSYAEDVEFILKATSKGVGTMGIYDNWFNSTKHVLGAAGGEKVVDQRSMRVNRFDYVLRKWGVRVTGRFHFDDAKPFKWPFNIREIPHNNSWVVDPVQRKCALTGVGPMLVTNRCAYDARMLQRLLPADAELYLPEVLTTTYDSFPRE